MAAGRGRDAGISIPEEFDLSLSRTSEEMIASLDGMIAMMTLQVGDQPGKPARGAFHALRCAARLDPISAYNLGNHFSQSIDRAGLRRPRRRLSALAAFERAAAEGLSRLLDASGPFSRAPSREHELRDTISRALTNIGADIANAGRPERAVMYFQQAIQVFPVNANAHVCLGNMGVHHGAETGIDSLAGIASWAEAARHGDYCHESNKGCPCRANVIRVVRQVERDYGAAEAREWIVGHYRSPGRKSGSDFAFAAAKASDAARLTGRPWPPRAVAVSDALASPLGRLMRESLEIKVTIAGSLIGSLCRLPSRPRRQHADILADAVALAHDMEPLRPFIGDSEWLDLGPPETLYLIEPAMRARLTDLVAGIVATLSAAIPRLDAGNAVLGALFHLDRGFRQGVTSMAGRALDGAPPDARLVFVPATVIGSPARH